MAAVYGAVATPSELTIVTDLVKRGPLRTLLTDKKKQRESLTPTIRHRIIKDVARGMAYLSEQGVQHRNLHSHNVLITKEWGAKVRPFFGGLVCVSFYDSCWGSFVCLCVFFVVVLRRRAQGTLASATTGAAAPQTL